MNAVIEREPSTIREDRSTWGVGLLGSEIAITSQSAAVVAPGGPATVLERFGWALHRASESVVSTLLAGVLLAFSVSFATLMILAVVVALTCGLACYA